MLVYLGALVLILMVGSPLLPAFAALPPLPPSVVSPSQILESVPVTLTNTQPVAAVNPFQQMVVVDSSEYSQYEAPNLQNVVWYYPNGTIIPAWIESGASSSSHATVWWLRLRGFPPHSSQTVYMGFAAANRSFLSQRGPTGEAPQLSPVYGEHDNGPIVFNFYDNFAGTALNSIWATYGYIVVNVDNGVTLISTNVADNLLYTNSNTLPNNVYDVYWKEMPSSTSLQYQVMIDMNVSAGYGLVAWDDGLVNGVPSYVVWAKYTNWSYIAGVGAITYPLPAQTSMHVSSFAYVPPHMYWSVNDNPLIQLPGSTSVPPASYGLKLGTTGTAVYVQWVRARSFPPNGVMPYYTIWPAGPGAFAALPLIPIFDGLAYAYWVVYFFLLAKLISIVTVVIAAAPFFTAFTRSRAGVALRRNWEVPFLIDFTGFLLAALVVYSLGMTKLADRFSVYAYLALVTALVVVVLETLRKGGKRQAPGNRIEKELAREK